MTNPLNPLLSDIQRYEDADATLKNFELKRADWTLKRFGVPLPVVRGHAKSKGGEACNFEDLPILIPDLQFKLVAEPLAGEPAIHRDSRCVHPAWFKNFGSLPFVTRYGEKLVEHKDPDTPLGMVFPRKGFSQGMIIHNGDFERCVPPGSGCHIHLTGGGKSKASITLLVQPYLVFIDRFRSLR